MVWLVLACCLIRMGVGITWDRAGRGEGDGIIARIRANWRLCVRLNIVSENKVTNINTQIPFRVADSQLSSINQSDKNSKIDKIYLNDLSKYIWNDPDNIIFCLPLTMWGNCQTHYWHRYGIDGKLSENQQFNDHLSEDFDVDDVGALCAAHGLVELGEAEILSVGKEIKRIRIFSCEDAAQQVLMSVCLSVCLSVRVCVWSTWKSTFLHPSTAYSMF